MARIPFGYGLLTLLALASCDSGGREDLASADVQSCMTCHNGSGSNNYAGPGLQDPHPFPGAEGLLCTTCHGGNPNGADSALSHVPPPPQIGTRTQRATDTFAHFNRLTLTGIDKLPDYTINGTTYTALDYLQFVNPGDLRVVEAGRACGQCHAPHSETVSGSILATSAGIFSGAMYMVGDENQVPANRGLFDDTAAGMGFRDALDPDHVFDPSMIGRVGELAEVPVISVRGARGAGLLFDNRSEFLAAQLPSDLASDNSIVPGSNLAKLYREQVAFTCGDCHLGSAGANNRAGDYRSSGCTACHMPYSLSGRHEGRDPNVNPLEPLDPDDLDPPERAHTRSHRIRSVHKTLPNSVQIEGIDDLTCAGCHQGSNRTVMQYWGIRLDQNQDVRRGFQYPANPDSFRTTSGDTRLFDPVAGNNTFNGRNRNQYLLEEDYDGDGRDDTPADVHYDAGMGCIDCHGSFDLHGGTIGGGAQIVSRMEQAVAIRCESCHGSVGAYANTTTGVAYDGVTRTLATDANGNPLPHVVRESDGHFYLYSKVTGQRHYVSQTLDTVSDNGRTNTISGQPIYNEKASYAMGRADGNANTGIGPQQQGVANSGFCHSDSMSCASCHSSWSNSCVGCHLEGDYNGGNNNFSNITGQRIVYEEDEAQFVYQSPVFFQLGIDENNKIEVVSPNTKMFYRYRDINDDLSRVFSFSDRKGAGNNLPGGHPSLGHNAMLAHSIRGKVSSDKEGPRYCVACHLTTEGLTNYGTEYSAFRTAMATQDYDALDFDLLADHFGRNTGNEMNSPLWVHMVAGLGTGLFLFDEDGCAVNKLDTNPDRYGCPPGQAPANNFSAARVALNLDRIVDPTGLSTSSSAHRMLDAVVSPNRRDGAANPNFSGPMGATLIQRLMDPSAGIVLNSWLYSDSALGGQASNFLSGM